MKKFRTSVFFFLFVHFLFGQAHIQLTPADENLLDSLCLKHLEVTKIPGMAVGIASKGKVLFSKGFGVKNIKTGEPVSTTSVFHLASVSKTMVATAIGQLVRQEKIHLDDPVTAYLPYFTMKDYRYKAITIKHLLTHTSGIPDVLNYNWRNPKHDSFALEQYVRGLSGKSLNFHPGEKFRYSNNGFEVLGDVIAKASGISFEDYIRKNILDPIGMENSSFIKMKSLMISRPLLMLSGLILR